MLATFPQCNFPLEFPEKLSQPFMLSLRLPSRPLVVCHKLNETIVILNAGIFSIYFIFSPSEGPCCQSDCQFSSDRTCKAETECSAASVCQGNQAQCPAGAHKPDFGSCNHNTQYCRNGVRLRDNWACQ